MTSYRLRSYIYLLFVAGIWGISGPVIKYTLPDFPPFIFLTYRFLISSLFFLPIILVRGIKIPKETRNLLLLLVISVLGSSINLGFLFYGYNYTSVLDASILSSTAPLFVVAAGALLLKERVTKKEKIGLIIAFLGSLTIIFQPLTRIGLFTFENILGNLFIIFANFSWVAYIILSKYELKKKIEPLTITFCMFLIGFLSLLPLAVFQAEGVGSLISDITSAPLKAHLGVWYMALLSGNLAYFLYQKGQKSIEASEAALFGYLTPLFAAPLAVFWLGESITFHYIFGAAIVAIGVIIAEYKKKKIVKKRK